MCGKNISFLIKTGCIAVFVSALLSGPGARSSAFAQDDIATLRGLDIVSEPPAPKIAKESALEQREVRNYPEQPPVIPHSIRGYQIDLNSNKCLSCHSRTAVAESGAPMVSVTHFMDRDGQVLSAVTSRRYFCNQCHVPQFEVTPLVKNTFVDAATVTAQE